ncbi:arsenate reductase family protein [Frigidibacter sp. MR17.24]|uniref:arsenate reductase family protein n=1 Tax=Frigidibacter sp. MR17.24 TaxID=3127345 RepID=UPI003012BC80
MILYGIATCDTCRKARRALAEAGAEVTFRDLRAEPLTPDERAEFLAAFGDRLINRSSTTWRGLSETERAAAPDALLAAHPTLMKRPVVRAGATLTLGWSAATLDDLMAAGA